MSLRSTVLSVNRPVWMGVCVVALLSVAAGCIAEADGRRETVAAPAGLSFEQWATVDVRGSAAAMAQVRRDIEALDPADRAKAAESLAILQKTCPYTRASLQLAVALHLEVQHLDKAQFDGLVHPDVDALKQGLSDHIAVLDALQVQLPLPERSDGLASAFGLVDRAQLVASGTALEATGPLVASVPVLVDAIEPVDMDRIRRHSGIVEHTVGHPWTFRLHLMGWRNALTRLEPFVQDEATRVRVRAMLDPLDALADMGC